MRTPRHLLVAGFALLLVGAACGGTGATTTTTEPVPETNGSKTVTTVDSVTTSEPTTGTTSASASRLATDVGLDSIVMVTPEAGGGDRPELEWQPIDGATLYQITVLAPDGSPYWGRMGPETSVPFGGFPRLLPEAAGPRIIPDMSWTVIAYDDSMIPLAVGGPRPVSP